MLISPYGFPVNKLNESSPRSVRAEVCPEASKDIEASTKRAPSSMRQGERASPSFVQAIYAQALRAYSLTQHLHVYLSVPPTIIMVYDHDLLPGT